MKFYFKSSVIDILGRNLEHASIAVLFSIWVLFFFLLQTLTQSGEVCVWGIEDGACVSRIYLNIQVSVPYKWIF